MLSRRAPFSQVADRGSSAPAADMSGRGRFAAGIRARVSRDTIRAPMNGNLVHRVAQAVRWRTNRIRRPTRRYYRRLRRRWTGQDSVPPTPKVFGIGLSDSSAVSLSDVLTEATYRCAGFDDLRRLGLDDWWDGDFSRDYLAGFDAAVGIPVSTMFRELDVRYPGSKFVLIDSADDLSASEPPDGVNERHRLSAFDELARVAAFGYRSNDANVWSYRIRRHRRDVTGYFATRPEQIFISDGLDGKSMDGLREFLGYSESVAPMPDRPQGAHARRRPNAVESATAAGSRSMSTERSGGAVPVVLIPLIHPLHPNVVDFDRVETLLQRTCASVRAARGADPQIVIVGHRRPSISLGDAVTFVDIGDSTFLDGTQRTPLDKGAKLVIAASVAERLFEPSVFLTVDADDLLHVDTVAEIARRMEREDAPDVLVWTHGAELEITPLRGGSVHYLAANRIESFDRVCGTSRAVARQHLFDTILDLVGLAGLRSDVTRWPVPDVDGVLQLVPPMRAALDTRLDSIDRNERKLLAQFGSHVSHLGHMEPIALMGAAKTCGHGQHEGGARGRLHPAQTISSLDLESALVSFGLVAGPVSKIYDLA